LVQWFKEIGQQVFALGQVSDPKSCGTERQQCEHHKGNQVADVLRITPGSERGGPCPKDNNRRSDQPSGMPPWSQFAGESIELIPTSFTLVAQVGMARTMAAMRLG
jgi:hypothetical protein